MGSISSHFRRYCYVYVPLIVLLLSGIAYILFSDYFLFSNKIDVIIGIAGSLSGFLITIWAIVFSIQKEGSQFAKAFFASDHIKIFSRSIIYGVVFFILCVIEYILLNNQNELIILSFIMGICEVLIATWYIYNIGKNLWRK